jgi:hypothetical protein
MAKTLKLVAFFLLLLPSVEVQQTCSNCVQPENAAPNGIINVEGFTVTVVHGSIFVPSNVGQLLYLATPPNCATGACNPNPT